MIQPAVIDQLPPELRRRYRKHAAQLHGALERLYRAHPGYDGWLERLLTQLGRAHAQRPAELRALDAVREADPHWFCSSRMLGYSCYVDRFGGTLSGVEKRIGYLSELGVSYLHLLPFLRPRAGASDGGFAVASFAEVDPALGTMDDLERLAARLRAAGISLCSDLVLNHVADDHPWARGAVAGDPALREFFLTFPDRRLPDQYEAHLAQVFPLSAPGNFTYVAALDAWVWTTFYPYQWDLNYRNPAVFAAMMEALFGLANRGVEVFRLDSIAYLWKRMGTPCTNQPEVGDLLGAMRALVDIVAPAVLLKAEAIMPTRELPAYFGSAHAPACHLAYHSTLMAAGWAALAEQDVDLLCRVIESTPGLPPGASWLTYVRCHDDIGWGILLDEAGDIARLQAVASFFHDGRGSYAQGVPFQAAASRPVTGTNGTAAALAGVREADPQAGIERLALVHGLALVFGGLPVFYMGDELAQPNDAAACAGADTDTRWAQRGVLDPERLAQRSEAATTAGRAFQALRRFIEVRRALPALAADAPRRLLACSRGSVLALERGAEFLCLANFSDEPVHLDARAIEAAHDYVLPPRAMAWLERRADGSLERLA
ncbi:MAG: alpha-amylase family glycosyl hydrolase [Telluria sp.]